MSELFASGRIVDLILLFMVLEAILMVAHWRITSRGLSPVDIVGNFLPGMCLLLALRGALASAWWGWIALCLLLALLAHLADLRGRWRC